MVVHQQKTCVASLWQSLAVPYRLVTIFSNNSAELISGLDKKLSHGLSQKVKSPIVQSFRGDECDIIPGHYSKCSIQAFLKVAEFVIT